VAFAIIAIVVGAIYLGTSDWGAEQQFRYGISNDSRQPVIVRFGSYGQFAVPAGASGRAADSFGTFHQDIEILDEQCRRLQSVEVTTQSGILWIRDDVPAMLNEVDWNDLPSNPVEPTEDCEAGRPS
jgi:hypothetical protein